jgi:hypothetical protein
MTEHDDAAVTVGRRLDGAPELRVRPGAGDGIRFTALDTAVPPGPGKLWRFEVHPNQHVPPALFVPLPIGTVVRWMDVRYEVLSFELDLGGFDPRAEAVLAYTVRELPDAPRGTAP